MADRRHHGEGEHHQGNVAMPTYRQMFRSTLVVSLSCICRSSTASSSSTPIAKAIGSVVTSPAENMNGIQELIMLVGTIVKDALRMHDAIRNGERLDLDIVIEHLVRNQGHIARQLCILASSLEAGLPPR